MLPDCDAPHWGHGFCVKHYARFKRHGDVRQKYTTRWRTCAYCGGEFEAPMKFSGKYCSDLCRSRGYFQERQQREGFIKKNCEVCGIEFFSPTWPYEAKICSQRCVGAQSAADRARVTTCQYCGVEFETANPAQDICADCSHGHRLQRVKARNRIKKRRARMPEAGGPYHSDEEWEVLLEQYNGMCAYCHTGEAEHRDHVVPLKYGGSDSITNILPACADCNLRKGSLMPVEWANRFQEIFGYAWQDAASFCN